MGSFKNVKIRTKLVGLVSVLSFFTLLIAGYGIYQAKSIDASYREIYEKDTSATAVAGQAGMYFNESRAVFLRAIMQQVPQERQESRSGWRQAGGQYHQEHVRCTELSGLQKRL